MPDILNEIIEGIRSDEASTLRTFSPDSYTLPERNPPVNILEALKMGFFFISECKKGSPSKGIMLEDYNPIDIANQYIEAGTSAISVITEKNYFFGGKEHLVMIRQMTELPILRKDFIFHPAQVYESYTLGADMVLLIVAALEKSQLRDLHALVTELGMTALVEVHEESELEAALSCDPLLLGINNRDLRTFQVDLENSFRIRKSIPAGVNVISESGISSASEIRRLKQAGFAGALIGESLIRNADRKNGLKGLIDA